MSGRIEAWFFGAVPVHAMVLNRMILGAVLFGHALSRVPEFGLLFGGASGAWSGAQREFVSVYLAPDLGTPMLAAVSALAEIPAGPRETLLSVLFAVLLASSLAFAVGLFTRLAGGVAVVLHLVFLAIQPFAYYGWGPLLAPFAVYVLLSPAGNYVSVDAWRRRRAHLAAPSVLVPAWPMRLLQLHVVAMYFHSGFARIDDLDWLQGEVLFEALSRTLFTRFTLDLHGWKPALLVLSYAVFLLEPVASVALWIPRTRTICALALLAMHVILEILTNVGWWNYMMIGGLLTFLPAPWVERLLPPLATRRD